MSFNDKIINNMSKFRENSKEFFKIKSRILE